MGNAYPVMKKLLALAVLVGLASSAFAGSCGGCKDGDKKDGDKKKEPTKENVAPVL